MRFDFSGIPLKKKAFSDRPMAFCRPAAMADMWAIMELIAIETGSRSAREQWQSDQLRNLVIHAATSSTFWKQRIAPGNFESVVLGSIPVLTRSQLREQVSTEGSLLGGNPTDAQKCGTSGSSGTPVEFFVSRMNEQYNMLRSAAQYFIEGRDLSLNRVQLRSKPAAFENGFSVARDRTWLGSLDSLVRAGTNRHIEYFHPDMDLLRKALESEPVGYLICRPSLLASSFQHFGPAWVKRAEVSMWIPMGEPVDQELRKILSSLQIPVRATYSSEEVGMIGPECATMPGYYHVATSNVVVEVDQSERIELAGARVGRVLVTRLHSYATPLIRYDLGDLACLAQRCACGHDGPTLSNVIGRSKSLLRHSDGRLSMFQVRSYELTKVADFEEYRIRQVDVETIIVEIARRVSLSPSEIAAVESLIRQHAGDEFRVEVRSVPRIDWGSATKRLGYHSDVA